eukprot:1160549-Pelagomonas_calceolata.AAC.4
MLGIFWGICILLHLTLLRVKWVEVSDTVCVPVRVTIVACVHHIGGSCWRQGSRWRRCYYPACYVKCQKANAPVCATAGDKWCLCASRWREAAEAGVAPPLYLKSTHKKVRVWIGVHVLCLGRRREVVADTVTYLVVVISCTQGQMKCEGVGRGPSSVPESQPQEDKDLSCCFHSTSTEKQLYKLKALEYVTMEQLKSHALDLEEAATA